MSVRRYGGSDCSSDLAFRVLDVEVFMQLKRNEEVLS